MNNCLLLVPALEPVNCVVDADALLLLKMLYSYYSFHFSTNICTRFTSLETSVIKVKLSYKCRMV